MTHSYTSRALAKQNGMAVGHRYWFAILFAEPGHLPAWWFASSRRPHLQL